MPDPAYDIAEEQGILDRLSQVHQEWRASRPIAMPQEGAPQDDRAARLAEAINRLQNPEPPDVVAIRKAREDPLGAAIDSQLSVVGWRLYAKGGVVVLTSVYLRIERDRHPAFAGAVGGAWRNIGFAGDPRGVWGATVLL